MSFSVRSPFPYSTKQLTNTSIALGRKAVQLIVESSDPLTALTHLSQNFPKYATSLARRVLVNSSVNAELVSNAQKVQGGLNLFWLNGQHVDPKDVNVFGLLGLLKKEKSLMRSILSLGLNGGGEALEVLTHSSVANAQKDGGVTDGLFDASDRPEEGGVVVWWNDFERDTKYVCYLLFAEHEC